MVSGISAVGRQHSTQSCGLRFDSIHGDCKYLVGAHQSATHLPTRRWSDRSTCHRNFSTQQRTDGGACAQRSRWRCYRILVRYTRHVIERNVPSIDGDEQHSGPAKRLWTSKLVITQKKFQIFFRLCAIDFSTCRHRYNNDRRWCFI